MSRNKLPQRVAIVLPLASKYVTISNRVGFSLEKKREVLAAHMGSSAAGHIQE
jgi:hypothetical protein